MNTSVGPVLLDFPYVYELDGKKLYCNKPEHNHLCGGIIDYDDGFNNLVCTKCGKRYLAVGLKQDVQNKKIILKGENEMEWQLVDESGKVVIDHKEVVTTIQPTAKPRYNKNQREEIDYSAPARIEFSFNTNVENTARIIEKSTEVKKELPIKFDKDGNVVLKDVKRTDIGGIKKQIAKSFDFNTQNRKFESNINPRDVVRKASIKAEIARDILPPKVYQMRKFESIFNLELTNPDVCIGDYVFVDDNTQSIYKINTFPITGDSIEYIEEALSPSYEVIVVEDYDHEAEQDNDNSLSKYNLSDEDFNEPGDVEYDSSSSVESEY